MSNQQFHWPEIRFFFCVSFAWLFIAFLISRGTRHGIRCDWKVIFLLRMFDDAMKWCFFHFQITFTCIWIFKIRMPGRVGLTIYEMRVPSTPIVSLEQTQKRQLATRKMGPFGCREKSSAPTNSDWKRARFLFSKINRFAYKTFGSKSVFYDFYFVRLRSKSATLLDEMKIVKDGFWAERFVQKAKYSVCTHSGFDWQPFFQLR